jgi:ABC-type nitrate/sulfonate/bicarbonate transport system permease component
MSKTLRWTLGGGTFALLLTLWFLASTFEWVSHYKLPPPQNVASTFMRLMSNGMLVDATLASMQRIALAALATVAIGVPLGVLMGAAPKINAVFSPIVDPFRSAPIVAFLPLFVMWLGIDELMKVSFLVAGAIVYLIPMVRDAIRSVPSQYLVSAQDIGAKPMEAVVKVLVPLALPRIVDAIIVSVSLMWTYITVAEYVNAGSGLGQLIQNARRFSAMDQVFVGILTIVVVALLTYQIMMHIKHRLFKWETQL